MGAFAAYTFVCGVVLFASYIIYKWLLSAENQPAFNRAVLLTIYVLSFAAWLLTGVPGADAATALQGVVDIGAPAATIAGPQPAAQLPWMSALLWIYAAGMAATALWTLVVAVRLMRIVASGERVQCQGYTLVLAGSKDIAPFSWGRFVVMYRGEDKETADMILCHEQAHIACMHFADLLLAQAVCIVLWYNPAAWLMLAELKSVHEYQADSHVLASGINARQYQILLIKKAVGVRFQSLANSLNHSNLKKRITMMCNQKTSAVRRSRALALVPAVALALALVNVPSVSRAIDRTASTELSLGAKAAVNPDKVTENSVAKQMDGVDLEEAPDVLPSFPGGQPAMIQFLIQNVKYPASAIKDSIQGSVAVGFTVRENGEITDVEIVKSVSPELDAEAMRVAKLMPWWIPGEKDGKKVSCRFALPVSFKLQ